MPLYDYGCSCGIRTQAFRGVAERAEGPVCCGKPMEKLFSPTRMRPRMDPKAHTRGLKDSELIELGDEHPVNVERYFREQKESKEALEEKRFEQAAEAQISEMGGWDCLVTRDPTKIREYEQEQDTSHEVPDEQFVEVAE